ncbi:MAG: DUF5678 domain-containing protein [Caldilineaceae bacterium]
MTALTLAEAPLIDQLQQVADREQTTAEALLIQAVVEFLERENAEEELAPVPFYDAEAAHAAFRQEAEAFKHLLPALLQEYQGKFVAIHQGQVVAAGDDRMEVYGVVLKKFGPVSCYIGHVDVQAPRPKRMPLIWKAP